VPVPRRKRRSRFVLRWLALAAVGLVALLYYRPLKTYLHTRHTLIQRADAVRSLRREKRTLTRRLAASAGSAALTREARRLGLVKPGERLFIVKGIAAWKHARSTIPDGGR
jgi:hypothetical protein